MTVLDYRSAPPSGSDAETITGHWLAWAVYLAMSWTWCIGMFLPVLLVRDYGIWGWIVFAIPNVLGAAAMGWVLRRPESGPNLVGAHRAAMVGFSIVTVTFQFYFAAWIFHDQPLAWQFAATAVIAGAMLIPASSPRQKRQFELGIAAAVLLLSVICAAIVWRGAGSVYVAGPVRPEWTTDLLALTPVMVFGFLLCPYLDLSFHNGRHHTTGLTARLAFSTGFVLIFPLMIAFTLVYARYLPEPFSWSQGDLRWGLAIYFMIQLSFTIGVHLREIASRAEKHVWPAYVLLVGCACAGTVSYWLSDWLPRPVPPEPGRAPAELVYRLYLGMYGLVFPAYVWLCMTPSPRATPTRGMLLVFAIAVLLAAPMFWMGFIQGTMIWLLPGLAVVLLARLAIRRNPAG